MIARGKCRHCCEKFKPITECVDCVYVGGRKAKPFWWLKRFFRNLGIVK